MTHSQGSYHRVDFDYADDGFGNLVPTPVPASVFNMVDAIEDALCEVLRCYA